MLATKTTVHVTDVAAEPIYTEERDPAIVAAVEIGGVDAEAREWAAHMMLIARQIERIGDHTVDIGEQIAFVISGEFREFTDASH